MSSTGAPTDDTSSSSSGGILSALGGLMRMADPQLLISVGAGLMSGARYGSNAGEGLMQGLQMYHSMKTSDLQNQLTRQQIQAGNIQNQRQQMMLNAAQQALGGQPGGMPATSPMPPQQAPAQSPQTPFLPGISPMPANGMLPQSAPPAPQGMPAGLSPPSMDQIYGSTYPGMASPNYMRSMAMFSQDPAAALGKVREDQLKGAQQQYAPTLSKLDMLIKSDRPSSYMKADSDLMAAWPQLAAQYGFDPEKDYNDQNVRFALTGARNALSSSLSEPTEAPAARMQNITLPDGRTAQVDPVSGKQTVEAPSPLEKVIGPNGQPTLVPAGKAAGMTPFNQSVFGAANTTDAMRDWAYQYASLHGGALPPGVSRNPAVVSDLMNYISTRAKQDGNSQLSMVAQEQQLKGAQSVVKDFTSGATAKTLNGLNTAISHMDQLDQAATALNNGNVQALNKLSNFFGRQFGSSTNTNFDVVKNFAAGEVAKAVLPGGGGEHEREEIADAIRNSNSPSQLHEAIQTWRNLLAGKTDALRNQWDVGTNGTQGSFDKFLLPATKTALGIQNGSGATDTKAMPTGDKLAAYAATHFGGDQTKAAAFLKSKGYQ